MSDLFLKSINSGRPLLLDGGMATHLESMGIALDPQLWSAALLFDQPQALVDAHFAFLQAGARCIISASYQASQKGFLSRGFDVTESERLITLSVELAAKARQKFLNIHPDEETVPLIAASVGPWGAAQHDGSEYTGTYNVELDALTDFHRRRLELLDSSGADVLACETIPSALEASVLAELLQNASTPAWMSFSCVNGIAISDGTAIAEIATLLKDHPVVKAIGVNCTAPRHVESLISEIRSVTTDLAIVIYPNSGETYDANTRSWSGTVNPEDAGKLAQRWLDAGAQIIGGCCRMGTRHIQSMHQQVYDR